MEIAKANFENSPYIGIFCVANDNTALIPMCSTKKFAGLVKEKLGVEVVKTTIANTSLISIFCIMNNNKIFVPDIIEKSELKILKDNFQEVIVLSQKYTALGNLVALNDKGAVCSKYLYKTISKYIKTKSMTIAGSDLIGSCLFVTNKAFLAHIDTSEKELKGIEKALKVSGDCGTVNFGDSFVRSGIIGNKRGILTGSLTSGPELNRIDDIFL